MSEGFLTTYRVRRDSTMWRGHISGNASSSVGGLDQLKLDDVLLIPLDLPQLHGQVEAEKATAISRALSALVYGPMDAGALSMNAIQAERVFRAGVSGREEQRRIETDRVLHELEVAYYASLDDDQSTIDSELEMGNVATPSCESTASVDTEVGSEETIENGNVESGKTEKTTESVDKTVEAAEKRVEEVAKEAWAPEEETVPEDTPETTETAPAEEKVEPEPKKPKAKKTSKSIAKFTEAVKELNALRDEQKAMRQREAKQKAAEEPEIPCPLLLRRMSRTSLLPPS